jgi:hypothetical protein
MRNPLQFLILAFISTKLKLSLKGREIQLHGISEHFNAFSLPLNSLVMIFFLFLGLE